VKGADFSPAWDTTRAMKRPSAIGQREKRIEDQKTRTLEDRKDAPADTRLSAGTNCADACPFASHAWSRAITLALTPGETNGQDAILGCSIYNSFLLGFLILSGAAKFRTIAFHELLCHQPTNWQRR